MGSGDDKLAAYKAKREAASKKSSPGTIRDSSGKVVTENRVNLSRSENLELANSKPEEPANLNNAPGVKPFKSITPLQNIVENHQQKVSEPQTKVEMASKDGYEATQGFTMSSFSVGAYNKAKKISDTINRGVESEKFQSLPGSSILQYPVKSTSSLITMGGMLPGGIETIVSRPEVIAPALTVGAYQSTYGTAEAFKDNPKQTTSDLLTVGLLTGGAVKAAPKITGGVKTGLNNRVMDIKLNQMYAKSIGPTRIGTTTTRPKQWFPTIEAPGWQPRTHNIKITKNLKIAESTPRPRKFVEPKIKVESPAMQPAPKNPIPITQIKIKDQVLGSTRTQIIELPKKSSPTRITPRSKKQKNTPPEEPLSFSDFLKSEDAQVQPIPIQKTAIRPIFGDASIQYGITRGAVFRSLKPAKVQSSIAFPVLFNPQAMKPIIDQNVGIKPVQIQNQKIDPVQIESQIIRPVLSSAPLQSKITVADALPNNIANTIFKEDFIPAAKLPKQGYSNKRKRRSKAPINVLGWEYGRRSNTYGDIRDITGL